MSGLKCSHCSKVCETTHGMTKHLSTGRVRRRAARRKIPSRIQLGTNDFLTILEAEATLLLAEQMERIYSHKKEEGLYTYNVEKMDPVGIAEYAEKADGEQVNPESVRSTCIRSRSGI